MATLTFTQLLSSDTTGECQARKPLNTAYCWKGRKRTKTKDNRKHYLVQAQLVRAECRFRENSPLLMLLLKTYCFMNFVCVSSPKMMYDYEDCGSLLMTWWNNYWHNWSHWHVAGLREKIADCIYHTFCGKCIETELPVLLLLLLVVFLMRLCPFFHSIMSHLIWKAEGAGVTRVA